MAVLQALAFVPISFLFYLLSSDFSVFSLPPVDVTRSKVSSLSRADFSPFFPRRLAMNRASAVTVYVCVAGAQQQEVAPRQH